MTDLSNFFSVFNVTFWVVLFFVIILQGHFVGDTWPEVNRWRVGYITLLGGTGLMLTWAGWDKIVWANLAISIIAFRAVSEVTLFREVWRTSDRENGRWVIEYFVPYLVILVYVISANLDLITWGLMLAALGVAGAAKTLREMVWQSARSSKLRQGGNNGRYGKQ